MNKLGMNLLFKPLFSIRIINLQSHNHLKYFFASSKQIKQGKSNKSKNQESVNRQILKSSTKIKKNQQIGINKQKSDIRSVSSEQQKNQLIFQQKLKSTYLQLQSLPSDSYQTVVQNFKRIKQKLMDRKVYLPNKPQLLQQLDKQMQFVKKHHEIWAAPSTAPQRKITDNKSEIIEWELQQAKKKYYLSLLDDQRFLIALAAGAILLLAGLQYYHFVRQPDTRKKAPKMYL